MPITEPTRHTARVNPYPWVETKKDPRAHDRLLRFVEKLIQKKAWKKEAGDSVGAFLRWRNRH